MCLVNPHRFDHLACVVFAALCTLAQEPLLLLCVLFESFTKKFPTLSLQAEHSHATEAVEAAEALVRVHFWSASTKANQRSPHAYPCPAPRAHKHAHKHTVRVQQ